MAARTTRGVLRRCGVPGLEEDNEGQKNMGREESMKKALCTSTKFLYDTHDTSV